MARLLVPAHQGAPLRQGRLPETPVANNMMKSIWELFTAPFRVIFKGRLYDIPTGRNPVKYITLWGWGIALLLFTVFIYPIFILITLLVLIVSYFIENDIHVDETGIEIFTKRRGILARYRWDEIEAVVVEFNPPFPFPELVLKNGERISLKLADQMQLSRACEVNKIKFIDRVNTG